MFTIPFETINLEAIRGVSTLSRLAGLLFFGTCLFYSKVCFRRPPQALWWFAGYVAVFGLGYFFIPETFVDPLMVQLQTFIQLLVFCWISSTLLQEEKFARYALLALSIATLLAATGILLGLPGFSDTWGGGDRFTAEGFNPNGFAVIMALGTQILIWFSIGQKRRTMWIRATFMAMSLLPLTAMVYTGSRGGITAFLSGVILYALPYCGSKRKMTAILGVVIAVVGVIYTVISDQSTFSRFESTYYRGDTAGRDKIFETSIEMISEKPLLGWRPMFQYELGPRVGKVSRDAHNLYLHLLMEGGLLGAMPYFIGLGLCVRGAWTARVRGLGLLPLVLLVTMMVANMSGVWIAAKAQWFVFTLSLASGAFTAKQYRRKILTIRTVL
jgi:O-antigen ligase